MEIKPLLAEYWFDQEDKVDDLIRKFIPIPIKNIYYMLAYAWNHPQEKESISVFSEDEKDLVNLFSKVLLIKVKALIKRVFTRSPFKPVMSRELFEAKYFSTNQWKHSLTEERSCTFLKMK